jgi:undecaprenyl pyrophosphate synthase
LAQVANLKPEEAFLMANPNTAAQNAASAAVNEAVRIAADNSRRSTEGAQAVVQASRRYLDQASQLNRDLFTVFSLGTEASLKTAFEIQNAAFAIGQTWLETSMTITKDAATRWADITRQAQTSTLKHYKESAKLVASAAE